MRTTWKTWESASTSRWKGLTKSRAFFFLNRLTYLALHNHTTLQTLLFCSRCRAPSHEEVLKWTMLTSFRGGCGHWQIYNLSNALPLLHALCKSVKSVAKRLCSKGYRYTPFSHNLKQNTIKFRRYWKPKVRITLVIINMK